MKTLAIDIETYSSADLKKTGVYKYVEAPDFTVLLLAYSVNGGEVQVIDVWGQAEDEEDIYDAVIYSRKLKEIKAFLSDSTILKTRVSPTRQPSSGKYKTHTAVSWWKIVWLVIL